MTDEVRELSGRAAIVTGSAKNIGRAIALSLAAGGADVVINARTSESEAAQTARDAAASGARAIVHMGDVTRPDVAAAMTDACVSAFGRLDFLVNNVSDRGEVPFEELTLNRFHEVLSSTLDSAFLCTQSALPHLKRSDRAAIVNIGGVASHAGFPERAHVAAAKAGLCGMTGSLAPELAPHGITVNTVIPALINTSRESGPIPPLYATRPVPMDRPGEPEEIASMVRYLCGPGARFVSGQSLHVNGAWQVTI